MAKSRKQRAEDKVIAGLVDHAYQDRLHQLLALGWPEAEAKAAASAAVMELDQLRIVNGVMTLAGGPAVGLDELPRPKTH